MLPEIVNAPLNETPSEIAAAYAAHLALTGRGNTAYTQAAQTFLGRWPHVQDWAERPLELRLAVNPSLRPFLSFLMLSRRLPPGYEYLLSRKFSSLWRDLGGSALESDLQRFTAVARVQGFSERVVSALASQVIYRLLIETGRSLDEPTGEDFDHLVAARIDREDRTGQGWRHYQDSMPAARQVLFHLGILTEPASSSNWLPTAERLTRVPEPLRGTLTRYLDRKTVTCVIRRPSAASRPGSPISAGS